MTKKVAMISALLVLLMSALPAMAQTAADASTTAKVDSGDTAFVLISSALVLLMTIPGLALFYGGMVRTKNVLGTLMQSFVLVGMISVQWLMWGYSIAFANGNSIMGSLSWIGLSHVGLTPNAD